MTIRTFTLDTNCLIAVDENRPEAEFVRALAEAHAAGQADVAAVAISASERQKDGKKIANFKTFEDRLTDLGLGHLRVLLPIAYLDICYFDRAILPDAAMIELEKSLHAALFPNIEFAWDTYCRARGLDINDMSKDRRWLNAKCDVQAIWAHANSNRDIFVTSDSNFHKRWAALAALGVSAIKHPEEAASLI